MNITQKRLAENLVHEIWLEYYRNTEQLPKLPLPIFDLAINYFGFSVDIEYFSEGKLDGIAAISFPNQKRILLNGDQGEERIRSALAHEVVHCLLEAPNHDEKETEKWATFQFLTNNHHKREQIAKYIAGAFLVPKALLDYSRNSGLHNGKLLGRLVDTYCVSKETMSIRFYQTDVRKDTESNLEDDFLSLFLQQRTLPPDALRPCYAVVKPPKSVYDTRFVRHMKRISQKRKSLYFLLDPDEIYDCDILMTLEYGDGFLFSHFNDKQLDSYLRELADVEFLDFENANKYYDWLRSKDCKEILIESRTGFTYDPNKKVPNQQLEIASLSSYVEPRVTLNNRTVAKEYIKSCKEKGKTVVVVTGCFDIITNTHIRFFNQAKTYGDILVVGIENDKRVQAFKGPLRPVNTESQRVEVLEELKCVDYTFIIHGSHKQDVKKFYTRLHKDLRADILAISERDPHTEDRRDEIEAAGGRLEIIQVHPHDGRTTSVLRKFLEETVVSDIVFLDKDKLYTWINENNHYDKQLKMALKYK